MTADAPEQLVTPESDLQDAPALSQELDTPAIADEPGQETAPAESDDEEIEHDGERYKIPRKLKDAFLRQADYTVKTQTLADQKREFEAAQQQFAAQRQFQQDHIKAVARVMSIDERLEQFQKLDWNALTDADPVQALKLDRQMRDLQQQRAAQIADIQSTTARQQGETEQATARRLQDAAEQLKREIPGFGSEVLTKALTETGKAFGYKPEELAQVSDPRAVKLLHEAYLYRKLVAERKAPEAKSTVTPITRVTGASATATRDPSRMTDHEFAQWRKRQIAQR